jgi:TetR/AcrR family transcriptional regulator, transcriptional repressor for nem operon
VSNLTKTYDEILTVAQSLILTAGYNGFSYADIADRIGVRKASIHHHFPSKADLIGTLVTRYRESAEAGIAQIEREVAGPLEQLRFYVGFWERCILDDTAPFCLCALLATQVSILPEEIRGEIRAHFNSFATWLASVLERGARIGQIRLAMAPRDEAEMVLATVHGAMLSARAYGDPALFGVVTGSLLQRFAV